MRTADHQNSKMPAKSNDLTENSPWKANLIHYVHDSADIGSTITLIQNKKG